MALVVFVGAHPDDIELGCYGAICRFIEAGYTVLCIVLTRGEKSGDANVREAESRAAFRRVGINDPSVVFGSFQDTAIPDAFATISFVESQVAAAQQEVYAAFIPSADEIHQDHRAAAHCCLTALRSVPRILAYESPTTTASFTPTSFVDITHYLDKKDEALQCHATQQRLRKMYLEYRAMLNLAAFRGRQAGVEYAEAFQTLRFLIRP